MRARLAIAAAAVAVGCSANLTPQPSADGGAGELACVPNLDGILSADEVPVLAGLAADYWVDTNTAVDPAGEVDARGVRVWGFGDVGNAARETVEVTDLSERWYASEFAGGQLATAGSADAEVEAVYSIDSDGLWIWGLASRASNPTGGVTLLVYEQPVPLLRFPLELGDHWTATGVIDGGQLNGLPYNGVDTYEVEVDASGQLELPHLTFTQAHRVLTRVEVAPAVGGVTATRRQVSFWFECFGEVARATSRTDDVSPLFDTAAELRRLAL
jgi:hypothetical protein